MDGEDYERLREAQAEDDRRDNTPSGMHGMWAPGGMHGIWAPGGMHGIWAPSDMHGIWVPSGMPNPHGEMLANQGLLNHTVLLHRFAPMYGVVQQCDPVHQLHYTPSYEIGNEPLNYYEPLTMNAPLPANRFDRIYAADQQYEPVRQHYHTPSHEIVNYYAPPPVNSRQCELAHEPSSHASSNSVGNEPGTSCVLPTINNIPLDEVRNESKKSYASALRNNKIPNSLVAPINYDGRIYEGWTPSYEVGDEPVNYCAPLTANRFDRIYAAGQQYEPVRQHYHTPSHEIVNYYAPPVNVNSQHSINAGVRHYELPCEDSYAPSYEVGDEPVNSNRPLTVNDIIPASRLARIYAPGREYEPAREACYKPSHEVENEATYPVNIGSPCENLEVWQLPEVEYYFRKLTKKDPDED